MTCAVAGMLRWCCWRAGMSFFTLRPVAGCVRSTFMTCSFMRCSSFVVLFRGFVAFFMAHDAHKIDGADKQAHENDYEPERGPERSLGLGLGVVIRLMMMMCTVI